MVICDGEGINAKHQNHHCGHERKSEPGFFSHLSLPFLRCHILIELGDILVGDVHRCLQFLDVDLLDVLNARGPLTLLEAHDAADDFDDALHE